MRHIRTRRSFAVILALCLLLTMLPFHYAVEAEAAVNLNSLTCSGFISNSTARNYIDTMMRYYINNNSNLQNTLNNGLSVVFMFEGGSDNYWNGYTYGGYGTTRNQAVVIVVQLDSSGNAYIPYYCENCSSIPDDPTWCTYNVAHNGSTTLMDGIYSFYTWNHTGPYGAFQVNVGQGYYTPTNYPNGQILGASGINIHTRTTNTAYSGSGSWSAGCQVIGSGSGTGNEFNQFMKVVAGINFNVFIDYYSKTFNTISTGTTKGYYVVDRQLGMMGRDGTKYGSGSLINLYNTTALSNITSYSTNAKNNANFEYAESNCTYYPSYCQIKCTLEGATINSQPCSVSTTYGSETLETATVGKSYTATGIFQNHYGNYWYRIKTTSGKTGYIYGGEAEYVKMLTPDISISNYTIPNGHVSGATFYVNGTVKSTYNKLTSVSCYIYDGFGINGEPVTGATDTAPSNPYTLKGSAVDDGTWMNLPQLGANTYVITAGYTNYYTQGATTLKSNNGTVELVNEYFMVIPSSVDQSTCSHSYTTTTVGATDCTEGGTKIQSCSKCGKIVKTALAAGSHSYGDWTTVAKPGCTTAGSKTRTCSKCGDTETQAIAAINHSYTSVTTPATCQEYAKTTYTCGNCGHSYVEYHDGLTDWSTTKPSDVDESLIESKKQYRYSDYETKTSYETAMSGYTLKSSAWEQTGTGTVKYVNSWPSGFSTTSSNYTTYNKKSSKVAASETTTAKTVVNSDAVIGYLYYHWCWDNSYYSYATKGGNANCTTFHSFYSTTKPSDCADYDAGDGSYLNPNSSCCSNSEWYWYVTVYAQKYTNYKKLFTYERWTDWSSWSETPVTASSTRKVESQTLYRYRDAQLGSHSYEHGTCTVCGTGCSHSYNAVETKPTCTAGGYTTYNCTICGHSYTGNEVAPASHDYSWAVTTQPSCKAAGVRTYTCSACNSSYTESIPATDHNFVDGVCATCGTSDPNYVFDYYLIGYINGADYGCEGDYANMGEYKFVDGKVSATFTEDSYVFIKTTNNAKWYMTSGWLGTETTTATLYNTASGLADANKLFVPGGVDVTFTLVVNEDDTLTLSYTVADKPVIEKINVAFSQIDMGNTLGMRFAFPASSDIDWNGAYAVATMAGSTQTIPATAWESANIGGAAHYVFGYSNIAAKQMADEITIVIYNADGDAISNEYEDSIQAYVMRNVDKKDAESKTLMVDMLNYGAAAQTYYGYNAEDLANAQLSDAQKAYGTAELAEITDGRVKGANYLGTRLELGSSIGMQMNFAGTTADMYAVVEFTNHGDTEISERVAPTEIDGVYLINITQIAVADGRIPVTVTVYNADGSVYGTATDSMASYIARMSNADALYECIMKFSDSAFAYLH